MSDELDLNAEPARTAALLGVVIGELRRMSYPHVDQLDALIDGLLDRLPGTWDEGYIEGYEQGCGFRVEPEDTVGNPYK